LVASQDVAPDDVRDFALRKCPALDFFVVAGGVATSCANGSKVRGTSKANLIQRLDAILLWNAASGFTNNDVDWEFEVIKGLNPVMTSLVTSQPFPSKMEALSSLPSPPEASPRINPWEAIKSNPIWIVAAAVVCSAAVTYAFVNTLIIAPLRETIAQQETSASASSSSQLQITPAIPKP
jgi:hypothetical protein